MSAHHKTYNRILLCLLVFTFFLNLCYLTPVHSATNKHIKIGVLAYQGSENAINRWRATVDLLTASLNDYSFELVPLSLADMKEQVANASIDFIITNTGNYVNLSHSFGVSRIATLINKKQQFTTSQYGAVIFTRADRQDINSLQDITGKTLTAVNENGFGGFYMALQEFHNQNIDLLEEAENITYTGFPQIQVLTSVLNGEADIGTFRTDSLEQLVANKQLDLSSIKILNQKKTDDYPFLHSTDLYPEWPFSKLKHVSKELAHRVALVLLSMPSNSEAAITAQSAGWTIPLNYKPAYDLLKSLEVAPFDAINKPTMNSIFQKYYVEIISIFSVVVFNIVLLFFIYKLNIKLRSSNKLLKREVRKRTRLANKLEHMASHDALTGIYNRRAFTSHLQAELDRSKRYDGSFSLMLLDIDNFKTINDKFGHQTGDLLLEAITSRIKKLLRSNDQFFRIGGDEFAIINIDIESSREIEVLCDRIFHALEKQYHLDEYVLHSSMSIGFAMYPDHGNCIKELIYQADKNMYQNKKTKTDYESIRLKNLSLEANNV